MSMICQKDLLSRHLKLMKRNLPRDYNFFPLTFCLPEELRNLTDYCERRKYQDVFIIKPDANSQGVGIEVIKDVKNFKKYRNVICQKYVRKPFLIDGFKMDLRLYVLITSVTPLRIYLYKEGLIRLATILYKKPSFTNLNEKRMHLTNYAVNRNLEKSFQERPSENCKKSLSDLEDYFSCMGLSISDTWLVIEEIIVKTILSVIPELQHIYRTTFPCTSAISSCYEVLGFDILLDDKTKPYLLEVNRSPSFGASTTVDRELKESLIRNVLDMILLTPKQIKFIKDEERLKSFRRLTNLNMIRSLTSKEQVLYEYQERKENRMCGNFRKIYPVEDSKYDNIYETAFRVSKY
nr:tubulin polyglutamylase TTLL6-like [Parasteatoda tepidariorum]